MLSSKPAPAPTYFAGPPAHPGAQERYASFRPRNAKIELRATYYAFVRAESLE